MEAEPWAADRDLDRGIVEGLLREQCPGVRAETLRFLGSGWDNDSWLADETWVFRFPRRAAVVPFLEREIRVLELVEPRLDVAVPRVEFRGRPGDGFPYPFIGYRYLEGVEPRAVTLDDRETSALAQQLGQFLTQLHGIPQEEAEAAQVPLSSWGPQVWLAEVVERSSLFSEALGDAATSWRPWWEGGVPVPAAYDGPPRLLHQDFAEEHLLLDEESHGLAGVIDWEDVELGDPVLDFLGLFNWLGEGFVREGLGHYEPELDGGFWARLRFGARTHALIWAVDKHRREPGVPNHWLELLDTLGPDPNR